MTRKIKFTLGDIDGAIKEIEAYEKSLDSKNQEFLQRLVDEGVKIAKEEAPVDFGDLRESIHGAVDGNIGKIVCDAKKPSGSPYAFYIEFGFGAGLEPWIYFDEKREEFKTSAGQAPNPFMYRTSMRLRNIAPKIAKEVFAS